MQRTPWIAAAGLAAAMLVSASAFARTDVSVNIGIPGPVLVAPAPVYAPPPVYAPAPLVVAPQPVYVEPHWREREHWDRGEHRGWEHRGWERRGWDRDDDRGRHGHHDRD
ncbi:signal peptide protein [Pandoraea terrae]|uniref:Signal peptide protein n=1 Tax=Pandoraea terrae TaxID=1537710 RepID=A0A5E4XNV0_9BURK|nr:hypothetical protein [Pandoraea terrae]VVE37722.1 signal peptide protein [Pandoraea terrae]